MQEEASTIANAMDCARVPQESQARRELTARLFRQLSGKPVIRPVAEAIDRHGIVP
jgi:hypothetical protein